MSISIRFLGPMLEQIEETIALIDTMSDADWKVIDLGWKISTSFRFLCTRKAKEFKGVGDDIMTELSHEEITSIPRTWKIFPHITTDSVAILKQRLIAAGVPDAVKWIDEGL
ncbi:hypothetical protein OPT61_g6755 [Boeremia exigua]|uniref:Uncharacterized protein n=1 Tax=Boeremia exigua TaxID=749465 RepID=A0ACC2I4S9_9PLEO|nr:hypothetical protein OPT61_g6755 [Boeremia exigua]